MSKEYLMVKREDYRTSHILHLLLSLVTGGLWLIVWVVVAISNASKRSQIDRQLGRMG